jgi:hypothetical protein
MWFVTDMPEPGRQAAHILIDMVSAFDPDSPNDQSNSDAMNLAFLRMQEIGAVNATLNEADQLDLDVSNLIGGAVTSLHWLAMFAAEMSDGRLTRDDVIVRLRDYLDAR